MNNIKTLCQNLFNGQDIFPDYEALTSEEDKIVLCEDICKELANQLDSNNTSNVEKVGEFLDKVEVKYAYSASTNFITIGQLVKHSLDVHKNDKIESIKTNFEKFPNYINKIYNLTTNGKDFSDNFKFKL